MSQGWRGSRLLIFLNECVLTVTWEGLQGCPNWAVSSLFPGGSWWEDAGMTTRWGRHWNSSQVGSTLEWYFTFPSFLSFLLPSFPWLCSLSRGYHFQGQEQGWFLSKNVIMLFALWLIPKGLTVITVISVVARCLPVLLWGPSPLHMGGLRGRHMLNGSCCWWYRPGQQPKLMFLPRVESVAYMGKKNNCRLREWTNQEIQHYVITSKGCEQDMMLSLCSIIADAGKD